MAVNGMGQHFAQAQATRSSHPASMAGVVAPGGDAGTSMR